MQPQGLQNARRCVDAIVWASVGWVLHVWQRKVRPSLSSWCLLVLNCLLCLLDMLREDADSGLNYSQEAGSLHHAEQQT